jgi:hypothetical protein
MTVRLAERAPRSSDGMPPTRSGPPKPDIHRIPPSMPAFGRWDRPESGLNPPTRPDSASAIQDCAREGPGPSLPATFAQRNKLVR